MIVSIFLIEVSNIAGYIRKKIWHSEFSHLGFEVNEKKYYINLLSIPEYPTLTFEPNEDNINQIWTKKFLLEDEDDIFEHNWQLFQKYHSNIPLSLAQHYFIYNNSALELRTEFEYLLFLMYALQLKIKLSITELQLFNQCRIFRQLDLDFRPFSCNEFIKRNNVFWSNLEHKIMIPNNKFLDIENLDFIKECHLKFGHRGLNEISKSIDLLTGQELNKETDDQKIDKLIDDDTSFNVLREHLNLI